MAIDPQRMAGIMQRMQLAQGGDAPDGGPPGGGMMAPQGGAPGGMPPGMPPVGGPPPGMLPMPRKSGGKVGHRSYSSYEDMDAGSGGGLGRLEKIEIAKKKYVKPV